ncbi:MAG: type II toxin-antitoxin system prevent-host-death family antitoxin [Candidatus Nanopelagicales bacterium]|nr:type II toxin-antitoxin system prevent-host-death family antitoxin [Candidatus Nanopelagicales bacterium]MCF8539725.1 type II toxin-antitoxin system prevent-host-death family antitoxin [Candidatus Nanopelagicales bacterium]MCF8551227.1 type II toxin-antitoxin system prevent-host-death family antitoxin [Candidatus Nanopelagicales bacterium]
MTIERISHRTLRNESGRVLKAVEQGETFIITNNGHDVATICPLSDDPFPGLTVSRSDPHFSFTSLIPGDSSCEESSAEILDYLRGDR